MLRKQPTYKRICEKCGCTFTVKSNNYIMARLCKACKHGSRRNYLAKYYLDTLKSRRAERRTLDKKN